MLMTDADLDLIDLLIANGEIGERPTGYSGMRPYGTTLRARRVLRRLADADTPRKTIFSTARTTMSNKNENENGALRCAFSIAIKIEG